MAGEEFIIAMLENPSALGFRNPAVSKTKSKGGRKKMAKTQAQTQVRKLFQGLDVEDIASAGVGAGLTGWVPSKIVPIVGTGGQKMFRVLASAGTAILAGMLINGVVKNKRSAMIAVAAGLGVTVIDGLKMTGVIPGQIVGPSPARLAALRVSQPALASGIASYPSVPTDTAFTGVRLV